MRKLFVPVLLCAIVMMCGCQTVKNTATGVGMTVYGFGKGVCDDTYNTYKVLDKADKSIEENYW